MYKIHFNYPNFTYFVGIKDFRVKVAYIEENMKNSYSFQRILYNTALTLFEGLSHEQNPAKKVSLSLDVRLKP